jgi:hypothetical protein
MPKGLVVKPPMIGKRLAIAMAVLAASTALAAPAMAADSALFSAFRTLCVANDTRMKPALAAADKAGWAVVPKEQLADSMDSFGDVKVLDLAARVVVADSRVLVLVAGLGEMAEGGETMAMTFCGVVNASGSEGILKEATTFAGRAPTDIDDEEMKGMTAWMYSDNASGAREYYATAESLGAAKALFSGRLRMLIASEADGTAMIMLLQPTVPD